MFEAVTPSLVLSLKPPGSAARPDGVNLLKRPFAATDHSAAPVERQYKRIRASGSTDQTSRTQQARGITGSASEATSSDARPTGRLRSLPRPPGMSNSGIVGLTKGHLRAFSSDSPFVLHGLKIQMAGVIFGARTNMKKAIARG